jgi:hypothetical protein
MCQQLVSVRDMCQQLVSVRESPGLPEALERATMRRACGTLSPFHAATALASNALASKGRLIRCTVYQKRLIFSTSNGGRYGCAAFAFGDPTERMNEAPKSQMDVPAVGLRSGHVPAVGLRSGESGIAGGP